MHLLENTYNPELQYVYYCIAQKALHTEQKLTNTVPEMIQKFLHPNKNLMKQAERPINIIKELFSLVPKIEKYIIIPSY